MNNVWETLPAQLQLRDADLVSLSAQDVEELFHKASCLDVLDQFAEIFWNEMSRVCSDESNLSMQECVDYLEERKRALGRHYSILKRKYSSKDWLPKLTALRYNRLELLLRWLCTRPDCERRSKEYLLEVNDDNSKK
jgi:hypothetical protein